MEAFIVGAVRVVLRGGPPIVATVLEGKWWCFWLRVWVVAVALMIGFVDHVTCHRRRRSFSMTIAQVVISVPVP